MPLTGKINADPLRVFFVSDYPLGREEGESASGSAHQIRDAAEEMWELGHDVVMIAPGYVNRPERDLDLPFFVRTMLFRPPDLYPMRNTTGARAPFNYPVLDKNPNHTSDQLLWDLDARGFDTLLSSYMGMFRLTSLIFGQPDVVVTSHAVSPWNYVASNYPLVFFSSESDRLPAKAHSFMRGILQTGIERAYAGVAFSELVRSRLKMQKHGYEFSTSRVVKIPKGIDPTLFGPEFDTTKAELVYRFSQILEGSAVAEGDHIDDNKSKVADMRWVVLYSKYDNPKVSEYLMNVASALEQSDENVMPIFITEGGGHDLCAQIYRFNLKRTRIISGVDRRTKAWFLNAADRALVYMGQELPSNDVVELKLDNLISSQTAVVFKTEEGPHLYFPGRIDPFSAEVIDRTLLDFDSNATDLSGQLRKLVRKQIVKLRPDEEFPEEETTGSIFQIPSANQSEISYDPKRHAIELVPGEEFDAENNRQFDLKAIQRRAESFALYKAWQMATNKISKAALSDELPELDPMVQLSLLDGVIDPMGPNVLRLTTQQKTSNILEGLLFKAKAEGVLKSAELVYGGTEHPRKRSYRLDQIALTFNPYAREAWEKLARAIDNGRSDSLSTPFKTWEYEVLSALYRSEFLNPSEPTAIPDPRRNPNGILSEISRLIGHGTDDVFKRLAKVAEVPREELIDDARKREPRNSGSGGGGNGSNLVSELRDAVGKRVPGNVVRFTEMISRAGIKFLGPFTTPKGRGPWSPKQ